VKSAGNLVQILRSGPKNGKVFQKGDLPFGNQAVWMFMFMFVINFWLEYLSSVCEGFSIVGRATLKMLRRKSKTQFVKQERNTQKRDFALLNYLKRSAPQQ
jgi:hypothetical protein